MDAYRLTPFDMAPLTRDHLLRFVSEEEIMARYCHPITAEHFLSPFREDRHPTCRYFYRKGRIYFKDFSETGYADAFEVATRRTGLGFYETLRHIAHSFRLSSYPEGRAAMRPVLPSIPKVEEAADVAVKVNEDRLTAYDKDYFRSFGIPPSTLEKFGVFSLDYVWINGRLSCGGTADSPLVGYYFGEEPPGRQAWKVYRYRAKSGPRFICNTRCLQGYRQLPKTGDILVWTKSLKDVMTLHTLGVDAVALQGEGHHPNATQVEELKARFTRHFSLYDYDLAGVRGAKMLARRFGIQPTFLTRRYGAKDPSDFVREHGLKTAVKLKELWISRITLQTPASTSLG